jgi:hypothetical protein
MSLRRLLPASLFAAAVALGGSTLGYPAIANAVWDIEVYDDCVATLNYFNRSFWDDMKQCCVKSGGVWKDTLNGGKCQAPPAESERAKLPIGDLPTFDSPTPVVAPTVPVEPPTRG